jgi:CheY-like chemotaxis protein
MSAGAGAARGDERKMKVLVVDDDAVSLGLLVAVLKNDHETRGARDGREALRVAREWSPDLVLLDVMMPDLDGLEVCKLLRADPALAETSVMFVTAVDSPDGERRGLELGAVDYLTKPVDLRLAKLRVKNQLELLRQRDRIREQNELLSRRKAELEATLARVKRLEGVLSICMDCKKIRAEDDAWQKLERYIGEHSDAIFSHGLCDTCFDTRMKLEDEKEGLLREE